MQIFGSFSFTNFTFSLLASKKQGEWNPNQSSWSQLKSWEEEKSLRRKHRREKLEVYPQIFVARISASGIRWNHRCRRCFRSIIALTFQSKIRKTCKICLLLIAWQINKRVSWKKDSGDVSPDKTVICILCRRFRKQAVMPFFPFLINLRN